MDLDLGFTSLSNATVIPPYLFTAPDASTHIFDFLADPVYQGFSGWDSSGGKVTNWTDYCSFAGGVFLGYGPFLGCLLYPNTTRNIQDGTLPTNLTDVGFSTSNETANSVSSYLRSIYPTCLSVYCASQDECAATAACDVGNLLTDGYELSAQGVGNCWQTLCSLDVEIVNPDVAGIGILLSYLIQSLLAFFALCILAILAHFVRRHDRRAASAPENSSSAKHHKHKLARARRHWEVVNTTLADFHKAQCYFAIALQIASLVVVSFEPRSINYTDQNFLLLVSLDGMIPIVMGLYALMTFGKKSWYMISLSVITVVLASASGGYIASHVLLSGSGSGGQRSIANGVAWPAACGGNGPQSICAGIGVNSSDYDDDNRVFLILLGILDVLTALLVLWKVCVDSTKTWSTACDWLAKRLTVQTKSQALEPDSHVSSPYGPSPRSIQRVVRIFCHVLSSLVLLLCLAVEFFYFGKIFMSAFVNFKSWGFGQIVGITMWTGVFVEAAYLEYFGVDAGSDWRFPKWLHVRQTSDDDDDDDDSNATQSKSSVSSSVVKPGAQSTSGQTSTYTASPYSRTLYLDPQAPTAQSHPRQRSTEPVMFNT